MAFFSTECIFPCETQFWRTNASSCCLQIQRDLACGEGHAYKCTRKGNSLAELNQIVFLKMENTFQTFNVNTFHFIVSGSFLSTRMDGDVSGSTQGLCQLPPHRSSQEPLRCPVISFAHKDKDKDKDKTFMRHQDNYFLHKSHH